MRRKLAESTGMQENPTRDPDATWLSRRVGRTLARGRWIPVVLFVGVCILMSFERGVHHGGDTPRYLDGGERLLTGEPLVGKQGAYVGYLAFVALATLLGVGGLGIVVAQIALSALCVVALYDVGRRLAGEAAGIAAASLYAANVDLARFTFSILTDSLYTSGLVVSAYLTYRTVALDKRWVWPAGAVVLLTASIRPGGGGALIIPVFAICLTFGILNDVKTVWKLLIALIVSALTMPLFAAPMRISYAEVDPVAVLVMGEVIYGDSMSRIPMPPAEVSDGEGSVAALRYCSTWPQACARLFLRRGLVYFAHTRHFYSLRHNLVILLSFIPLYVLALIGLVSHGRDIFGGLALGLVFVHATVAGLTFADWDGRFLMYVFPLVTLYSGIGAALVSRQALSLLHRGPETPRA